MARPYFENGNFTWLTLDGCSFGPEHPCGRLVREAEMTLFYVGGLNELDQLHCRRTRSYRIDTCPVSEVVHDIEEPWEREQRIQRLIREELRKTNVR